MRHGLKHEQKHLLGTIRFTFQILCIMNNDIFSWLGSLSVLGGLVLLCLIGVGIDAYNGSENGMIRNAKDYNP